jgi:FkbM family methyltransferase
MNYFGILTKYLLIHQIFRIKISNLNVMGFRMSFFDFNSFLELYEDIFIQNDYFFETVSKAPVILDCGSNIGMSVIYFKKLYPGCTVTAFEPDGITYKTLCDNIEANNLKGVRTVNRALHGKPGKKILFYTNAGTPGSVAMNMIDDREGLGNSEIVTTDVLSKYVKRRIDLVKMDIEGAEDYVVPELNNRKKLGLIGNIIMEYHHHTLPDRDVFGRMLSILEKNGFGYQVRGYIRELYKKGQSECMLIYAYKKQPGTGGIR